MKCLECKEEITKENQKVISGIAKYRSKCKKCINKYIADYIKNRNDKIKKASWFDVS